MSRIINGSRYRYGKGTRRRHGYYTVSGKIVGDPVFEMGANEAMKRGSIHRLYAPRQLDSRTRKGMGFFACYCYLSRKTKSRPRGLPRQCISSAKIMRL